MNSTGLSQPQRLVISTAATAPAWGVAKVNPDRAAVARRKMVLKEGILRWRGGLQNERTVEKSGYDGSQ